MEGETEDWVCKSCGDANLWALLTCEGCGLRRTVGAADAIALADTNSCLTIMDHQHPRKTGAILGLRKWPSLQQAAEKSWEICDQSSVASSIMDIARLSDLEGTNDHMSSVVDAALDAESRLRDTSQPARLGESISSGHADDEVSLADSWCQAAKLDLASVASSWQDVGNLHDIDTCSVGSWLQITALDEKEVDKTVVDAAAAQPIAGGSQQAQVDLGKACIDRRPENIETPNRHAVLAAEEHEDYDDGYAHIRFRARPGDKVQLHRRGRAGRHCIP